MTIRYILLLLIVFSAGIIIAGGVFSFIVIIGIVPRMIQKTNTNNYVKTFENSIILGGIFGAINLRFQMTLPFGIIFESLFAFFVGIFIGSLAVSLAEVLDVIPILTRRINLKYGMGCFMLVIAIGKLIGALAYFLIPGFFKFK